MYLDEGTSYCVELADTTTLFNSKSIAEWFSGPVGESASAAPEKRIQLYLRRNPIVRLVKRILKKQTASAEDGLSAKLVSWNNITHAIPHRLGLVMPAGLRIALPPVEIPSSGRGLVVCGPALPTISPDGLDIQVRFRPEGKTRRKSSEITLARHHFSQFSPEEPWIKLQFSLEELQGASGSLVVECGSGPGANARNDLLALYELVISSEDTLKLNRARAFNQYRTKNELQFFESVYQHKIYEIEDDKEQTAEPDAPVEIPEATDAPPDGPPQPVVTSNAYSLSFELLDKKLNRPSVDFIGPLTGNPSAATISRSLDPEKNLRLLSICAGAARIETEYLKQFKRSKDMELTLLDINSVLLETAKRRLSKYCSVKAMVSDVNRLELPEGYFDIILCVSGLHHVVELEHVFAEIAKGLNDEGEFWSIGEYVGRNGNRLWPEAYEIANSFFMNLPDKYRVCRNPGSEPVVHQRMPNYDCSITTFEGIRSEDILPCLEREFEPVHVDTRCCFTWRLFDLAYLDNYDTSLPEDVAIVEKAVELEYDHYLHGGKPTVLNGIYKKRSR